MTFDLSTVDYVHDVYNFVVFSMAPSPLELEPAQWNDHAQPIPIPWRMFREWNRETYDGVEDEYDPQAPSPVYRWSVRVNRLAGIGDLYEEMTIDGRYFLVDDEEQALQDEGRQKRGDGAYGTQIFVKCQSLFLFTFLSRLYDRFALPERLFVQIGNDVDIYEFTAGTDKLEFLEYVSNHAERLPGE